MTGWIIEGFENVPDAARRGAVTIGNFDGVHVGHQTLLGRARALADREGERLCAATFDPAPAVVAAPDKAPDPICPLEVRTRRLLDCGADLVVVVPTTPSLLAMSPEAFVRDLLVGRLAPRHVIEGAGFAFGHHRSGSIDTLRALAPDGGFEVTEVSPVRLDLPGAGEVRVSSSLIRRLIRAGDVASAGRCLGRDYTLYGRVVGGEQRGRVLKYPTANVDPGLLIIPADGIYAAWADLPGRRRPAAVSIGNKPTFGPVTHRVIEANLIDAEGDFYGLQIALTFLARLRETVKFPDAESLRAQIAKDVERVRAICR